MENSQFHGSDLETIERMYQVPKDQIISFGANVNPLGLPKQLGKRLGARLDVITRYPDREYVHLRRTIAHYVSTKAEYIMVGNGCTELITLFMKTFAPRNVLILGPTYSEYEHAVTQNGGKCQYIYLKESWDFMMDVDYLCEHLTEGPELLIICNPNNPTSSSITPAQMKQIIQRCMELNIFVLIDETYVEFAPKNTPLTAVPLVEEYTNLMILRGTSKFFACPGLRLGYAISSDNLLLLRMKNYQDPWPVNSIADAAAPIMFNDKDFLWKSHSLIDKERIRLKQELSTWKSIKVYDASANFFLVKIVRPNMNSDMVFKHCLRRGLMIRDCSSFSGLDNRFFRFCIMLPTQNNLLLKWLRVLLEDGPLDFSDDIIVLQKR